MVNSNPPLASCRQTAGLGHVSILSASFSLRVQIVAAHWGVAALLPLYPEWRRYRASWMLRVRGGKASLQWLEPSQGRLSASTSFSHWSLTGHKHLLLLLLLLWCGDLRLALLGEFETKLRSIIIQPHIHSWTVSSSDVSFLHSEGSPGLGEAHPKMKTIIYSPPCWWRVGWSPFSHKTFLELHGGTMWQLK